MKTLLLATVAFPAVAFAQTSVTTTNSWSPDLSNTFMAMVTVAIPTVSTFLIKALLSLAAKWGLEATASQTAQMEAKMTTALNVGIAQASEAITRDGWNGQAAKDVILGRATSYLNQHFPDAAGAIVTAASAANKTTAVQTALSARLPAVALDAAASPATPPKP